MTRKARLPTFFALVAVLFNFPAEAHSATVSRGDVRLALWGFSAAADDREGASLGERLATLTEAELVKQGAEVVERREFARILEEHKLAFTQFADARKAAQAGKLVRADVVLVGSVLRRGERRAVTMKAVETASGRVLDACATGLSESSLKSCAKSAAGFVMAARGRKLGERVFLAVGGFEDLSIDNRFADLGRQLRGALTVAFRGDRRISLVEREHVEPLLLELGLSKSALASPDFGKTDAVPAFLVVDGLYQSYRADETGITLNLRLQEPGHALKLVQLDAEPGPPLLSAAVAAIKKYIAEGKGQPLPPSARKAEAEIHFKRGCEQARMSPWSRPKLTIYMSHTRRMLSDTPEEHRLRRLRSLKNAICSFESAALLDPSHGMAKIFLATCLSNPEIGQFEGARRLLNEVIDRTDDAWHRQQATYQLGQTYIAPHAATLHLDEPSGRRIPNAATIDSIDAETRRRLEADYRTAIALWRGLAKDLGSLHWKTTVLRQALETLNKLRGLGLASTEECVELVRLCADINCRAELECWEKAGRVDVGTFRHYWVMLRRAVECWEKRSEERDKRLVKIARSECLALAEELCRRYPRLSYALRYTVAETLGKTEENFPMAEEALRAAFERPADFVGLPRSLLRMLPYAVLWCARLDRWEEAAHFAEALEEVIRDSGVRLSEWDTARYSVMRARCYEELGQWRGAARIYESLGDLEVGMGAFTPFGEVVVAKKALARCRRHLGVVEPTVEIPSAPVGKPVVELPAKWGRQSAIFTVSSLALDPNGDELWIGGTPRRSAAFGNPGQPLPDIDYGNVTGLYRYDPDSGRFKGELLAEIAEARWVTYVAARGRYLYVGTYGAGLFELDPRDGVRRRWTTADGLLDNCISCFNTRDNKTLWVGFAKSYTGGCGRIDLFTGKFFGLSPRLQPTETKAPFWDPLSRDPYDCPPKRAVTGIAEDAAGKVWVGVYGKGLQLHNPRTGRWETARKCTSFTGWPRVGSGKTITSQHANLTCLAVSRDVVAIGALKHGPYGGSFSQGSVDIFDTSTGAWDHVRYSDGLPDDSIFSLAVQGNTLWIGGHGYVAAYDLDAKRVVGVHTLPRVRVRALLPAGNALWIGAGRNVYRIETR